MGGRQHHRCGDTVLVGVQPAHGHHTPPVSRLQAGEAVLRARRTQIVADGRLVLEKLSRDDGAHGVATEILRPGAAAAVPVEPGERIGAALFQRPPKHVSIGHVADPIVHSREVPQDKKSRGLCVGARMAW